MVGIRRCSTSRTRCFPTTSPPLLILQTALSPLLWAAILGMGLGAVWPKSYSGQKAGVAFAKARLLRLGIVRRSGEPNEYPPAAYGTPS